MTLLVPFQCIVTAGVWIGAVVEMTTRLVRVYKGMALFFRVVVVVVFK